jgi:hypothetical protein
MSVRWIKPLFIFAGIYEVLLGAGFVFFSGAIFARAGVPLPNHMGYLHFPALLLLLFGILFFRVAGDPQGRRELIPYGMGLKVAYCSTVFWYQLHGGIPMLWIPWAWADLVFLLLFFAAWKSVSRGDVRDA